MKAKKIKNNRNINRVVLKINMIVEDSPQNLILKVPVRGGEEGVVGAGENFQTFFLNISKSINISHNIVFRELNYIIFATKL